MAERRMFSKTIIGSGKFLRMPPTSRLLYYDLGMAADDDGVVEAYSVMTQTKATEDDLRVLISKGYVRLLNDELVSLILDWKTNNTIRADRYHPSIYAELISSDTDNQLTTTPQPTVNQMETEVRLGKDRLGKVRLGKDRLGKERNIEPSGSIPTRDKPAKHRHGEYQHVLLSDDEFSLLIADLGQETVTEYIRRVDEYCESHKKTYNNYALTIRTWHRRDQERNAPAPKQPEKTAEELYKVDFSKYRKD